MDALPDSATIYYQIREASCLVASRQQPLKSTRG